MSWVKIDDQFADHPKVIEAGPLASWLYVCGLTYCARYLTDGYIPRGQVRKLADIDNALELAEKLVSVGLWEYRDGGFWVHDYLVYNPSGEKVKAEREANLRRQAEWREKNRRDDGTFGENNGDDNNDCNGVNNGVTNGVTESVITTAPSPSPSPSPYSSPSPSPSPSPVPVSVSAPNGDDGGDIAAASAPNFADVWAMYTRLNPRRRKFNEVEGDMLSGYVDRYGATRVIYAIEQAAKHGADSLAYIEAVLTGKNGARAPTKQPASGGSGNIMTCWG